MKRFIDEKGQFEIEVPSYWKYSLKDEKVHTFQDYFEPSKSNNFDTFQISINTLVQNEIGERIMKKPEDVLHDISDGPMGEGSRMRMWAKRVGEKFVLFTLIYQENLKATVLKEKIDLVEKVLASFRLIDAGKSEAEINSYLFEMFLKGTAATVYMLNSAIGSKSFIEATCLFANQIDALLRTGIILQTQLLKNNSEIERKWIYQGMDDKIISEKAVYSEAKDLGVIDSGAYDQLIKMYDDRNKVIHRFIISEITLADVEEISYQYYLMQQKINGIIHDIEARQIELGVGMTRSGDSSTDARNEYEKFIEGKFGKIEYFDKKKRNSYLDGIKNYFQRVWNHFRKLFSEFKL